MQLFFRRRFISVLLALSGIFSLTQAADAPKVLFKTSMGNIVIELDPEKAPRTVDNFLAYVKSGYYKGAIFHRVINDFMIQGGGFDINMKEKTPTRPPIRNEAQNGLKNDPYTIAMARTGNPHSATAQFFINVNANDRLNYPASDGFGYAVFGKVISGMEVVDQIKLVEVANRGMHQNVPLKPVLIESVSIIK
jgi:cyclophilin family peptidyl-prolyl cis-trans isomerase